MGQQGSHDLLQEATVIDDSGAVVPTEAVTAELESRGLTSSVRWALPDNPEVLMGKPTLRG